MDSKGGAPAPRTLAIFLGTIYVNAFVLGAVIMGYEMLGSRYLSPYFGGDIYTWGALISTVLLSLMLGAYAGGHLADRYPSTALLGSLVAAAAVFFFALPIFADGFFFWLSDAIENVHQGVLLAAFLLNIVPITVLGVYTPFAVRLMIRFSAGTGRLVGSVSALSTFGSIVGTLTTTFYLVPSIGSRDITLLFGAITILSAASLMALTWIRKDFHGDETSRPAADPGSVSHSRAGA